MCSQDPLTRVFDSSRAPNFWMYHLYFLCFMYLKMHTPPGGGVTPRGNPLHRFWCKTAPSWSPEKHIAKPWIGEHTDGETALLQPRRLQSPSEQGPPNRCGALTLFC